MSSLSLDYYNVQTGCHGASDYLGDGAYIQQQTPDEVLIYTSNGIGMQNSVVLDSNGIRALLRFLHATGMVTS